MPVNDLNLNHEVHSRVKSDSIPPVLLHGGGDTIKTSAMDGHVLAKAALSARFHR